MAEEVSFNKKLDIFKLIMSSLFARRQDWMIFNGMDPNTLVFSNIPDDRVPFYRSDIDDSLAIVKMTDTAANVVYELFPFLRQSCGIVDMKAFLSSINKLLKKNKGCAPSVYINKDTDTIEMDPISEETTELFETNDLKTNTVIGRLLSEDVYEGYKNILKHFESFSPEIVERDIEIPSARSNDLVVVCSVDLHNSVYNRDVKLRLPIQDGTNVVSYKEYMTKRKAQWKLRATIQYNEKHSVAKVSYGYRDDYVDVVTISPGALWFPFFKK